MKAPYCDFCGDCCRGLGQEYGIEITPADAKRMATFLKLSVKDFLAQYTYIERLGRGRGKAVHYLLDVHGQCVLLQDNRCSVHPAKPMQCYLGWPDNTFISCQANPRDYPCITGGPQLYYAP